MTKDGRVIQIDMGSLLNDVTNVVNSHVNKAVLNFNITGIQQDIDEYSSKIQGLEEELECLSKSVSDKWSRIQQTTHQVNVSLLEQEIASHREKVESMKKELSKIQSSGSDDSDISENLTNNIVLNIQELPNQSKNNNSVELLDNSENEKLVEKANKTMDAIYNDKLSSQDNTYDEDEINEILPEEEEEEEEEKEEEEEEGVFEIELEGMSYFTTDEQNGSLYSIDVNGDPDVYVGKIENGIAIFK